jgi:aspartate kinase
MISTSEVSISLTSGDRVGLEAAAEELRSIGDVAMKHGKTILVVVGQHLPERPGIGARILGSVAGAGVNVEMISYGMNSINFTMLIDDADIGRAVRVLHAIAFADPALS